MSLGTYTTYIKGVLGLGRERGCLSQRKHQTSDKNRPLCMMIVLIVQEVYKYIYSTVTGRMFTLLKLMVYFQYMLLK